MSRATSSPPALERLAQDDRIRPEMIPLDQKDGSSTKAVTEAQPLYGTPVIYLTPLYFGEKGVAERLKSPGSAPSRPMNHVLFAQGSEDLLDEQQAAILMAFTHPISVLTGGPGTGKTTCLKALIATLEGQHKTYALASPTGRAAKTIHRLPEYSPVEGFQFNDENRIALDFLVVDEASMLDLMLTNHLLKAVRPGTHVLFSGNVDQLPSVGASDVLRDLIDIVTAGIPQKFGFHSIHDIQVLSPIYRGPAGVTALSERLQEKLNPPAANKPERRLFGTVFRTGDKVMQTRNNYDKDVYNGDIGFIRSLDMIKQTLTVDFDGRIARYDWGEADELTLAYVVSVHKARDRNFPWWSCLS